MIDKIWNIKSKKIKEETIDEISKEHHIPRVISTILLNRGIESEDIAPYLRKSMADIINPMLMLDMDKAVERITNATNLVQEAQKTKHQKQIPQQIEIAVHA